MTSAPRNELVGRRSKAWTLVPVVVWLALLSMLEHVSRAGFKTQRLGLAALGTLLGLWTFPVFGRVVLRCYYGSSRWRSVVRGVDLITAFASGLLLGFVAALLRAGARV